MNPKIGLLSFPPEENQLHKPYRWDVGSLGSAGCNEARLHCARTTRTRRSGWGLPECGWVCSTLSSAELAVMHVLIGFPFCLSHCAVTTLPA